jgi:hypothetical protein
VNQAQQRFLPSRQRVVPLRLLFYDTTVRARDALFGFPIGHALELRYPNGHVERPRLGGGGKVRLRALPRGDYEVKVSGAGISFTRPLSVSRNQEVELKVLSWLDLGLAALALASVALGLLVVRRPHLLRRVPLLRRRATAGSHGAKVR